ncbi:hypothetical protein IAU60_003535 [Kwoniella sp. DSM 27419]
MASEVGMASGIGHTIQYQLGGRYLHAKTRFALTLRYVGPLPPPGLESEPDASAAIWLGVEYDNPSNGKGHDGLYKGTRVFQTAEPGSAAFLKAVGRPLLPGRTLVDSLEERYGLIVPPTSESQPNLAQDSGSAQAERVVLGSSNEAIIVEAPNLSSVRARVGKLEKIRNMGFEEEAIASLGGDEQTKQALRERMRGLKWLNLSRNLITDWQCVAEIVDHFEGLETLTLNHSRLSRLPDEPQRSFTDTFSRIRELHLSDCLLDWAEVCRLIAIFPALETLHLEANRPMQLLDRTLGSRTKLKEIRLAGCPVRSWETVQRALNGVSSLTTLDLSFSEIDSIPAPSTPGFPSINSFTILSSKLTSWSDLTNLSRQLPDLTSLRFSLIPASFDLATERSQPADPISQDEKAIRSMCIAIFQNIVTFNSTAITATERRDAEKAYIAHARTHSTLVSSASGGAKLVRDKAWPRYLELCKKYDIDPEAQVQDATTDGASKVGLKGKMISITIFVGQEAPKTVSILPIAPMTLLHKKVARLLGHPPSKRPKFILWTVRRMGEDDTNWERAVELEAKDVRAVDWWFSDGDAGSVEML